MTKQVTEEMISAFIDGELSPEDKLLVENAVSTDESMRQLLASFKESSQAIRSSSDFVLSSVTLPADFSSRVMEEIASASAGSNHVIPDQAISEETKEGNKVEVAAHASTKTSPSAKDSPYISVRTWIEVLVAAVAILVVYVNWPTPHHPEIAKPGTETSKDVAPKNGVRMMGSENGEFKKSDSQGTGSKESPKQVAASREFSIFVNAATRPQVDRFWIMNNYEVSAPENTQPNGANANGDRSSVNVLMIDSKKADAVKFFAQLPKWDKGFQVFQEAKSGSASWLAPFDVSKASEAEGDYWTLKIILIER